MVRFFIYVQDLKILISKNVGWGRGNKIDDTPRIKGGLVPVYLVSVKLHGREAQRVPRVLPAVPINNPRFITVLQM